jgi:membrane protein implicated in regulation of membrane protease activity
MEEVTVITPAHPSNVQGGSPHGCMADLVDHRRSVAGGRDADYHRSGRDARCRCTDTAGFAALGLPVAVQLLAFTVTAAIGVLLIRPVVRRHMLRPQLERFGVEALIGKPAYVVSEVSRLDGRVRIGGMRGEEWTARAYDQTLVIPAGATVDVLEISGTTALVYPRE